MTLESLKQLVMKQAEEKGFGTRPDQISVSEKLILIEDEGLEAEEAIQLALEKYDTLAITGLCLTDIPEKLSQRAKELIGTIGK